MILMFAGSNHPNSINHTLIEWVSQLMEIENKVIVRLSEYEFPVYSKAEEEKKFPEGLEKLKESIDSAITIIISVPEHNGSIPAFFKNILDWLSRYQPDYKVFSKKKIYLLSTSPGLGGTNAINHTSTILARMGATIEHSMSIPHFYQRVEREMNEIKPNAITKELLLTFINKI